MTLDGLSLVMSMLTLSVNINYITPKFLKNKQIIIGILFSSILTAVAFFINRLNINLLLKYVNVIEWLSVTVLPIIVILIFYKSLKQVIDSKNINAMALLIISLLLFAVSCIVTVFYANDIWTIHYVWTGTVLAANIDLTAAKG